MRRLLAICLCLLSARAAMGETMPPKPAKYFNDQAGVVSASVAASLDEKLRQFERDTSNQIVVAVFPKLETESSVQDYTYRISEAWSVGQKDRKNGAILFVFVAEHKMFIQVGYGLEGVLPDAISKRIIADEIAPQFKTGNYEGGLTAGVEAMLRATKGEYTGSGRIGGDGSGGSSGGWLIGIVVLFILLSAFRKSPRGTVYSRSGRGVGDALLWGILGSMSGSGRGGGGFGGGSGGGGGGFSAGGGSFGGGGAGGDW